MREHSRGVFFGFNAAGGRRRKSAGMERTASVGRTLTECPGPAPQAGWEFQVLGPPYDKARRRRQSCRRRLWTPKNILILLIFPKNFWSKDR